MAITCYLSTGQQQTDDKVCGSTHIANKYRYFHEPDKVCRTVFIRLPTCRNIGEAMAEDLRLLGRTPQDNTGSDPGDYAKKCSGAVTGVRQDPCVIDVFWSVTRFLRTLAAVGGIIPTAQSVS